jgi:hypothetical protein
MGRDQGRELIRGDWIAKTTRGHDVGNKQLQGKLAKLLAKGLILSTTETPHAEATVFVAKFDWLRCPVAAEVSS